MMDDENTVEEKKIPWLKANDAVVSQIVEIFSVRKVFHTAEGNRLMGMGSDFHYELWSDRLGGKCSETVTDRLEVIVKKLAEIVKVI